MTTKTKTPVTRPPLADRDDARPRTTHTGWRLVAIVLVVLVVAEGYVRLIAAYLPPPTTPGAGEVAFKKSRLEQLGAAGGVSVVFMGDSMMDSALDPAVFLQHAPSAPSAYNASLQGSRLTTQQQWAHEIVLPAVRPKVVLQAVNPTLVSTLGTSADQLGVYDAILAANIRSVRGDIWQNATEAASEHVYLVRYRDALRRPGVLGGATVNRFTGGQEFPQPARPPGFWERTLTPAGQVTEYADGQAARTGPDGLITNIRIMLESSRDFTPMNSITSRYKSAGVQTVVVIQPVAFDIMTASGLDVAPWKAAAADIRRRAEAEGLPVIDFSDTPYTRDHFFDPLHLNAKGSARFSTELAQRYEALCQSRTVRCDR